MNFEVMFIFDELLPIDDYTLSVKDIASNGSGSSYLFEFVDINNTSQYVFLSSDTLTTTFTTSNKIKDVYIYSQNDYASSLNVTTTFNNIMLEKAERLITDEANSNNELINLNLQAALVPRQKAAEQFNKLFGLTGEKAISVRVRSDLHNIIKEAESIVNDYKDMENVENITIDEEEGGNE